jgi:hypothetical protein
MSGWYVLGACLVGVLFIWLSHLFSPFVSRLNKLGTTPVIDPSHTAIVEKEPKDT